MERNKSIKLKAWLKIVLIISLGLAGAAAWPSEYVLASTVDAPPGQPSRAKENSSVKIEIPQEFHVGAVNMIKVTLTDAAGRPIADQTVATKVNGENDRRGRTSFNGATNIIINQKLNAGPATVEADFDGSSQYNPSSASIEIEVLPGVLEISVVPPVEGVVLSLNGARSTSGPDGVVRFPLTQTGDYPLAFIPQEATEKSLIKFHRWGDNIFTTERMVPFPLRRPIQVGLDVSYQVSIEFYDMDGNPVSMDRVESYTIKGSNGTPYTFTDLGPHWLPASRVTRRALGLEETHIQYSVMDVQVDGSNVVTQAQQRFLLDQNAVWKINLLFYSASFTSRDALFGFPLGTGIELHYPDGRNRVLPFNEDKRIEIDSLARGLYQVRVANAPGFSPVTPMALSRNQEVDLMVVSYFDMMVAAGLALLVALGLILIGRPGILSRLIPARSKKSLRTRAPEAYTQIESSGVRKDGTL